MQLCLKLEEAHPPSGKKPVAVAIGVFDGVHLAHQKVIDDAVRCARETGGLAAVFTFSTYPIRYFQPEAPVNGLTPWPLRAALIAERGVDLLVAPPFDAGLANISAQDFIEKILHERIGAGHVFVGFNFCFGRNREGTCDTLRDWQGELFGRVEVAEPIKYQGEPISSTRLRKAVLDGDLDSVQAMLGRPYALYGEVVRGDARGGKLGIPTANFEVCEQAVPPPGIFGSRAFLPDGNVLLALTYIGSAPTFRGPDAGLRVETMLLGEVDDIYDHSLRVELLTRIRDEVAFSDPQALLAQIRQDEADFRAWLDRNEIPPPAQLRYPKACDAA